MQEGGALKEHSDIAPIDFGRLVFPKRGVERESGLAKVSRRRCLCTWVLKDSRL